ncbi:hypothetical protein FB451DRAFT_1387465 [Mycena latifolia]|nr:hypothetical protein FB451DRAFT_1414470 [Mycena latifolia]KAJ7495437.1 hypothetical protein FB451DRAFT_1387465 [Mycena latifolia]
MTKPKAKRKKPQDDALYDPRAEKSSRVSAEEKVEKRRKADRERYKRYLANSFHIAKLRRRRGTFRNPEIREKKRIQMANKRAAIRAKRRLRDPPKKTQTKAQLDTDEVDDSLEESDRALSTLTSEKVAGGFDEQLDIPGWVSPTVSAPIIQGGASISGLAHSATSAEHLVTMVLAGMAQARLAAVDRQDDSVSVPVLGMHLTPLSASGLNKDADGDSVLHLAMQLTSTRSSVAQASIVADAAPAVHAPSQNSAHDVLPPGASPLTATQSLNLLVSGTIGPLTTVQRAQVAVAELNSGYLSGPTPAEANLWADENDRDFPPELKTMSREHWLEVNRWETQVGASHDEAWDEEAQRAFLEAENSIRLLRIRDKHGQPVRPFFNRYGDKVIDY